MQSIAIFNNKGGVGKTTLLCNLASFLAIYRQKKVLIVDADPQCNATQNLFHDDKVANFYETDAFTVDTIIRPLAQGKGYSQLFEPAHSDAFGLDVIPGDPRLALTEDLLATDWVAATSGSTRGLRTSFVFSHLLERCSAYDLVMFDMGPSLGSINRAVLISADYFVTPMSIDIFSLRAIDNISISVDKWSKQLQRGLDDSDDDPEALEVTNPGWNLKFGGYVTQQYTAKRDAEGNRRPVKAFEDIMNDIPLKIEENFSTWSDTVAANHLHLGSIPTFHSLIPMSQTSRKPIIELKGADGVVGAHFAKVKEYRGIISSIADRLLSNIDQGGH